MRRRWRKGEGDQEIVRPPLTQPIAQPSPAQPSPAGLHAASALSPSQNISRLHHRNVKTFQLSFLSNSLEILFCTEEYSGRVGGEDMVMGGCYLGEWMEIEIILDE